MKSTKRDDRLRAAFREAKKVGTVFDSFATDLARDVQRMAELGKKEISSACRIDNPAGAVVAYLFQSLQKYPGENRNEIGIEVGVGAQSATVRVYDLHWDRGAFERFRLMAAARYGSSCTVESETDRGSDYQKLVITGVAQPDKILGMWALAVTGPRAKFMNRPRIEHIGH